MSMSSKVMVLIGRADRVAAGRGAVFRNSDSKSNIELTKNDLAIIHRIVDEQIHGKAVGTTASWSNSEFGQLRKHNAGQKVQREWPALRIDRIHVGDAKDVDLTRSTTC